MIPVCMEKRLQDPNTWTGIVGGSLGGNLYVDMTDHSNNAIFKQKCIELKNMILTIIGEDVSKHESQNNDLSVQVLEPMSSESCSLCSCFEGLFALRLDLFKIDQELPLRTYTDVDSFGKLDSQTFISGKDHAIKLWKTYKDTAIRTYHLDARYRLAGLSVTHISI